MKGLTLIAVAAGLLVAAGCSTSSAPAAQTAALPPCCQKTADLKAQVPQCCRSQVDASVPIGECCKASKADPANKAACCKKTEEIVAQLPECCKKQAAGEPQACCSKK